MVVDARYLSEPFGSMTVYCRNLLQALATLDLAAPPVALIPRALDPSAEPIRDALADTVRWVTPSRDIHGTEGLAGELRWVHREVPALLARSLPRADVLIMPYHHPPARVPGVHRVVVLHDLCGLGLGFPKHKSAYWRHYLRLRAAARLADTIWPISSSTRDAMVARFRPARSRIGPIVHNGVDRQPRPPEHVSAVLAEHGLRRHAYVVAFATWQERKNFGASLAALTAMRRRGMPLRLVGIAPAGEHRSIRERCRSEGHDDAVILSGVSDDDLDALYAGALALLWPSTCEGFGYPVVEAMVQGCPPLVGRTGPGAELIQGAFEPLASLDPTTIAARLEVLRDLTSERRDQLDRALRARAASFSSDRYRDQLRDALLRLPTGP